MKLCKCIYQSPLGTIEIDGNVNGITQIYFTENKPDIAPRHKKGLPYELRKCRRQIDEYFRGDRKNFSLKLVMNGTDFQKRVWEELENIPYGETATYKDIAEKIENPKGVRAVGGANNKNKLAIVVPCHRIIGSNGKLTGYAGGIWRKEWLLNHENAI